MSICKIHFESREDFKKIEWLDELINKQNSLKKNETYHEKTN